MYFYQATLKEINYDIIKDSVFRWHTPTYLHFNFIGYPDIKTFDGAFRIFESKRKVITNPFAHGIMVLNLEFAADTPLNTITINTDTAASAIYKYFNEDLFIISVLFKDEHDCTHSYIIISDIEKSLDESSKTKLPPDLIMQIINSSLGELQIEEVYQDSLYLYNAADKPLAYDGVFHLRCPLHRKAK